MKIVRSYSSLLEAQLAQHQLREAGIGCDILDEANATLFPAGAFADGIRLAVADEEEDHARAVLGLPDREARLPSATPRRRGMPMWAFLLAALALLMVAFQSDRFKKQPQDGKGVTTLDRNQDGQPDQRTERDGSRTVVHEDNNFDGKWDYRAEYEDQLLIASETDVDFDGAYDWKTEFKSGVPVTATCRPGGKGPILCLQTFRSGILATALVDSDGDGNWDYRAEYDSYGRELSRTPMKGDPALSHGK